MFSLGIGQDVLKMSRVGWGFSHVLSEERGTEMKISPAPSIGWQAKCGRQELLVTHQGNSSHRLLASPKESTGENSRILPHCQGKYFDRVFAATCHNHAAFG